MARTPKISESVVAAAAGRQMLIFPVKEGGYAERSVLEKTKNQLRDMCDDYGVPVTGNKDILQIRLREYSEKYCNDPDSCDLKSVKRRQHKGARAGPKKTKPKKSALRRAEQFNTENTTTPTERSKDTRSHAEVKSILTWCDDIQAKYPYKPRMPAPTASPSSHQTAALSEVQNSPSGRGLQERVQAMEEQLASLSRSNAGAAQQVLLPSMVSTSTTASPLPSALPTSTTAPSHVPVFGNTVMRDTATGNFVPTAEQDTGAPLPSGGSTLADDPDSESDGPLNNALSRTITLGNNVSIDITRDKIRNISVPVASFSKDIERMIAMWDDTSPNWGNDSILKIQGQFIALIYWPKIFKNSGSWKPLKSRWTDWKFIAERYRQSTPDNFWSTFTAKGERMTYTAICAALRKERKEADAALVQRAQLEYGEVFQVKFQYRSSKHGQPRVMTRDSAIAKEYRRLHNLT